MWPRCLNLVWTKALGTIINQSEILPDSGFFICAGGLENKRFMPSFPRPQNSRVFFSKSVKKSVKRGVRVYFSLVPVLLFDCSRVLENAKIRAVYSFPRKTSVQSKLLYLDEWSENTRAARVYFSWYTPNGELARRLPLEKIFMSEILLHYTIYY